MARSDEQPSGDLAARLSATRALTLDLAAPLSDADATIQPHPDASPAKWHLAHTTWFFETFILRDHVAGYRLHDERWPYLFNSYYEGEGERHARPRRGMLSRPSLDEIREWRRAVDEALAAALPGLPPEAVGLVELGIQHEQQHQELFLTDLLASLAENPLEPAYGELDPAPCFAVEPLSWIDGRQGLVDIGAAAAGFAFDCERPRHKALLHPHRIASRCVTTGEWAEFVADGGYDNPSLWLCEGWDWVKANTIDRPLYWHEDGQSSFTLAGHRDLDRAAPVDHIS
jgi:ergothioneine biosynthesis protein EgtB